MQLEGTATAELAGLSRAGRRSFRVGAKHLPLIVALAAGWFIWHIPPAASMDPKGFHFLATLTVAVTLWVFAWLDDYVVGLMLLLSWVVLEIVPSKVALAGFSEGSWFFVVGALGIGAAVSKTGLLHRLSVHLLSRIPIGYSRTYSFFLLTSGLAITPLLPTGKARTAIALPLTQSISRASGFEQQSSGSAALNLAALVGFSQMSFMFLTGGEFCLIGWNLLPSSAKSEFGWVTWFVAALPAGVIILLVVLAGIFYFFPVSSPATIGLPDKVRLKDPGPIQKDEWIALTTLGLMLTGWLTMSLHEINEAWVTLAALLVFLITGVLDKHAFKNNLDWGLIVFFGIVTSMAAISSHLRIDRWFIELVAPVLMSDSLDAAGFLALVILLVCAARLFVRKSAVITFFTLTLVPLGQNVGLHPGVVLLTIVMASECFFLPYQDGPYQIAYSTTSGSAFSHSQARKILVVRWLATFIAIAISIPYWRMLGLISGRP